MTGFLILAFLILVASVAAVPLASRFGLGSVLGYLIAGTLISPLLALLHVDVVSIQHFAEFGVVIMLFLIGLELEPRRLWSMRKRLLGLGTLQMAGCAALLMPVGLLLDLPPSIAIFLGLTLALSSTAFALQVLNERRQLATPHGQSAFSILLFQDLAVIPLLALLVIMTV